jgi:hypothetical protein
MSRPRLGLVGADLLLWENCQWPYTLPAYEQLFPGSLDRPPEHFAMLMQPASPDAQAFGDSLPHTLSLLQAIVPGDTPRLADLRFAPADNGCDDQQLSFRYCTDRWSTRVDVVLSQSNVSPRRAAYALDGHRARRRVAGASYRLSFVDDDGREVALEDPMTLLIADFASALRGRLTRASSGASERARERARGREIAQRMDLLEQLVAATGRRERHGAGL